MRVILDILRNLYFTNQFLYAVFGISAYFVLSYAISLGEVGYYIGIGLFVLWVCTVLADAILLFNPSNVITAHRDSADLFSLGDENLIEVKLNSTFTFPIDVKLVDELPKQLQRRDFAEYFRLNGQHDHSVSYSVNPKQRGSYRFGDLIFFVTSRRLGMIQRRIWVDAKAKKKVYPSILQMKQMELISFANISNYTGIKKIRRIGHSYEFEQIKEYVEGDDYRSLNWKATGRTGRLMVNQYEDEKSQPVYSIIDCSRNMKMPFYGLSLLDYAVNTSLVISNIALKKDDLAGVMTYSNKTERFVKAERSALHLQKILGELYNVEQTKGESDYELLYYNIKRNIRQRSLIFLYLNFETTYSLQRVLPILRKINRNHVLVVVYFENSEINAFSKQDPRNIKQVYDQVIAEKHLYQSELIAKELNAAHIQTIYTKPEDLSIKTVNKYLELKARGYI